MRAFTGLVAVVSLLLALSLGPAAEPAAAHGINCQPTVAAGDVVLDLSDCGVSGRHSECVSHAGCLAFTVPIGHLLAASLDALRWTLPTVGDELGLAPQPHTPPPIPAA